MSWWSWKLKLVISVAISLSFIYLLAQILIPNDTIMSELIGLDFEVYGRVQGVFFRKYTQKKGKELGLHGWCMNTDKGTVVGRIEGQKNKIEEMKYWLQHTGSPESEIDKAEFRNEKEISEFSITGFDIRR